MKPLQFLTFAITLGVSNAAMPTGGNNFNHAGMLVNGSNAFVPLQSITVNATMFSYATDVRATLIYVNSLTSPIECEFVFPITNDAAVYKLEVQMGGRQSFIAAVKPRDDAMEIYQNSLGSHRQVALLESQVGSDDVYRIILGNLGPGETAVVTIGFAQPMDQNPITGELSLTLPVVLNPRYIPMHLTGNSNMIRTNFHRNVSYVAVSDIPYRMNFFATFDMGTKGPAITSIKSGNVSDILSVRMEPGNKKATARLVSKFNQDHDFQIRVNVSNSPYPILYEEPGYAAQGFETWANYDVLGAWMVPSLLITVRSGSNQMSMGNSNFQYWILYDRSGSMMDEKFDYQREALILILKSLPKDCYFNMIGFETYFEPLFDRP